jgi:hypothetical protein
VPGWPAWLFLEENSKNKAGAIMEQWIWGYCAAWVTAIIFLVIELKKG